jgi:hypothetical protein
MLNLLLACPLLAAATAAALADGKPASALRDDSFHNEHYAIAAEKGEVTGQRSGRMAAEIKLVRAAPGSQPLPAAVPGAPTARRILFLGNSITRHGPAPKIGWTGNWGMAASAEAKDYVHLLTASLAKRWGRPPEVLLENISAFERHCESYDVAIELKKDLGFKADLVVVAIGENVPALRSEEARTQFKDRFLRLLTALKSNGRPEVFVRSCFWADKTKDQIMHKACDAAGGVFVDISGLGKDETNCARSERSFAHAGVAAHPGDKGMKAIADALLLAVASHEPRQRQGKQPAAKP